MKTMLIAGCCLLLAAPISSATLGAQASGIKVGAKAPGALVESLDGKPVDLARYIGTAPVLIQFWATWCGNCKKLEPQMLAAQKKYAGKVSFVGVAVSVNQSPERVKLYAAKHGLPFDVLYDRKGWASDAYEVAATSYIVVIDRKGTVVYTGLGADQDIDAAIRKAL
jgi:thiol-disulfide isomerase/thioredoxin